MEKIIKLYHGTIHTFDAIDVAKGKPYKDFGAGFYLSPSALHSANLAARNREIELLRIERRSQTMEIDAWVYTYELDLGRLNGLNVKNFPDANGEWMKFVVSNRNNQERQHEYDIVTGPTANDNTRASIQAFFAGVYGDINSDAAVNILISVLEPHKLPIQYFFGSQRAAELLVFKDRAIIK